MKITLQSTTRIIKVNGADARIWEGTTDRGIAIVAIIPRIAVRADADISQFTAELNETPNVNPSRDAVIAFDARLAL